MRASAAVMLVVQSAQSLAFALPMPRICIGGSCNFPHLRPSSDSSATLCFTAAPDTVLARRRELCRLDMAANNGQKGTNYTHSTMQVQL